MITKNQKIDCKGLRVLFRAPYPPPYGGIATLIFSLLPGLRASGAEDVAVVHYGTVNAIEKENDGTIYRFNLKTQVWKALLPQNWPIFFRVLTTFNGYNLDFRQLIRETTKAIVVNAVAKKHNSNVVNFHQSHESLESLVCKQLWGSARAIVLTIYGEIYDNMDVIEPRPELYRSMIDSPSAVLASSAHCARSFKKIGINRPIDVIYVGVDMDRFAKNETLRKAYRDQLKLGDNVSLLLYMGRFESEMGLDSLIEIVPSIISSKGDEVKIIFAGAKGPLVNSAMECQNSYPDHIVIMNNVPFDLQPSLYAAADIVLTPSRAQHACMGVTIKEAMAASRTVIGSDSGGIPEAIIHGVTGLIVPLKASGDIDNQAFEVAILSLIGERERCMEMGNAARKRAAELFSEETTINRTAKVLMDIMPHA